MPGRRPHRLHNATWSPSLQPPDLASASGPAPAPPASAAWALQGPTPQPRRQDSTTVTGEGMAAAALQGGLSVGAAQMNRGARKTMSLL